MIAATLFCRADSGAFGIAKPLLFCNHTPMAAGTPVFLIALYLGFSSAGWIS